MRVRRLQNGYTIIEVVLAISLALVLFPAIFPPLDVELRRTGDLYEQEAARFLLEGELARVRDDAGHGLLAVGATTRSPLGWKSAERFDSLGLSRVVTARPDGLLEVKVEARWRSRSRPGRPTERLELTAWVAKP